MLRRSNSSTHIPVRLFRNSTTGKDVSAKKRSSSTSRLDQQRDSIITKSKKISLDRPSTLSSFPKTTPLSLKRNFNTPTPSSSKPSSSIRSRSLRISPATGLKDKKTIKKLSSDPKWVAQQFTKVKNFISNSGLFDQAIINPSNIKPPSIKGFIYLITTLLQKMFPVVNISQDNYKEEIVKKLKALNYPGVIANSTMKTVNTMHSWPQVMGMCGWLIDKIELYSTGLNEDNLPDDRLKYEYELPELLHDFILRRYSIFNEGNSDEVVEQCQKKFEALFKEILCFNPEEYQAIQADYDKKEEYKKRINMEITTLLQETEGLKGTRDKLLDDLLTLQNNNAAEQAVLECELTHFSSLLTKLTLRENELKSNVMVLEEGVKTQPCTYQEKKDLQKEVEALKKEIAIATKNIEDAQRIKHEFDTDYSEEFEKLRSKTIQWNRSLRKVCIKKPQFKNLLLKETGFHRKECLEEIREVSKIKQEIEIKLCEKVEGTEVMVKQLESEIQSIKTELTSQESEINQLKMESTQFIQNKAALDEDTKQVKSDWEIQKMNLLSAIDNILEDDQLRQQTEENLILKENRDKMKVEVIKFKEKSIAFFIDLDKQIDSNIKEMNELLKSRKEHIEQLILKRINERESLTKYLESLMDPPSTSK